MKERLCAKCGEPRPSHKVKYCEKCSWDVCCYKSKPSKYSKERYHKNSKKIKARSATWYADIVGKLDVIYECRCKDKKKFNHHFDYDRPREVIRLCRNCHLVEHYRLKSLLLK